MAYYRDGGQIRERAWVEQRRSGALRHRLDAPLRIGLIDLIPRRPEVARHIVTLLSACGVPVQVVTLELSFMPCRKEGPQVLARSSATWADAAADTFDGLLFTDSAAAAVPFESAPIWQEFCRAADWAQGCAGARLFLGWSAQAALYHRHGIVSHRLAVPQSGPLEQNVFRSGRICMRDLGSHYASATLRDSEVRWADVDRARGLYIAAASAGSGVGLVEEPAGNTLYAIDHPTYDATALHQEAAYRFPHGARHGAAPDCVADWTGSAALLVRNWLDMVAASRQTDATGQAVAGRVVRAAAAP